MAKYHDSKTLGVDVDKASSATQEHPLGLRVQAEDATYLLREYEYVKAGAAIAVGDVLTPDFAEEDNSVAPIGGETPISGVAHVALNDNEFGFVVVRGVASAKAAATVVAGAHAVGTATAGTVDDSTASAANAVAAASGIGVIFLSVSAAGVANVKLF